MFNFIFDIGGVLINFDKELILEKIANLSNKKKSEISYLHNFELVYKVETGRMSSFEYFNQYIKPLIPFWQYEDLINLWKENFSINKQGKEIFFEFKNKGFPVHILSNIGEIQKMAVEMLSPNFLNLSEKNFLSYKLGCYKPEPEIYLKVLDELKIKPQECIFLDDTINNVKTAKKIGMNAFIFSNKNLATIKKNIYNVIKNGK